MRYWCERTGVLIAQPLSALMNLYASLARWCLRKKKKAQGLSPGNSRPSPCPCRHNQVLLHGLFSFWATETRGNCCTSPAPFPQRARSRTAPPQEKDWCDFLSPWRACEANVILEFSGVQEPAQLLSSKITGWPLHAVILQWHQRARLQLDCLNKKSGLMIFIF